MRRYLKEGACSETLLNIADELRALSNGDDNLERAAIKIEDGDIEEGFDIANLTAENASDEGDDEYADAIWDALAPLRQLGESCKHKNKKENKMTLSERKAYNAGYRRALKEGKYGHDPEELYDVADLLDEVVADIRSAAESLEDGNVKDTSTYLTDVLSNIESDNVAGKLRKIRSSLDAYESLF